MEEIYHIDHRGREYVFPLELSPRFWELVEKIKRLDYIETIRGYEEVLQGEFGKYRISFKRGRIYSKRTPSWEGDDEKGTLIKDSFLVRIVRIEKSFIKYRKIKKIWLFYFSIGEKYILNRWSFARIFEEVK